MMRYWFNRLLWERHVKDYVIRDELHDLRERMYELDEHCDDLRRVGEDDVERDA